MKEVTAQNCGREKDLIGFLYGELNEVETRTFQGHLYECSACSTELDDFREVRDSVVGWRNESLAGIGLASQIEASQKKPSAVAAWREFFNLSPLWMKGSLAFAALLLCVLGGLAVARFREQPRTVVVTMPASPASAEEIRALVDRQVQEELTRLKNSSEQTPGSLVASDKPPQKPVKRIGNRSTEALATSSQSARRPLSKSEREQLAADLRLVANGEGDLDLLDDTINQ